LLLWALGAAVLVAASLALADPVPLMLALDPELVALLVVGSVGLLRASAARAVVAAVARRRVS
jgi:hypothetical protein